MRIHPFVLVLIVLILGSGALQQFSDFGSQAHRLRVNVRHNKTAPAAPRPVAWGDEREPQVELKNQARGVVAELPARYGNLEKLLQAPAPPLSLAAARRSAK